MIDSWLSKSKLRTSYEKVVKKIFLGRISANHLTLIGLFFGLASAFVLGLSGLFIQLNLALIIISLIIMTISFLFDTLDGPIARGMQKTVFGGIGLNCNFLFLKI
ncbi:MAG: CDP-alcohol phosphatidyltransferase family protein [Promethearchaeia archaeon]